MCRDILHKTDNRLTTRDCWLLQCTYAGQYMYTRTHPPTSVHTRTHMNIHTLTHTHTRTYTHMYIYIHKHTQQCPNTVYSTAHTHLGQQMVLSFLETFHSRSQPSLRHCSSLQRHQSRCVWWSHWSPDQLDPPGPRWAGGTGAWQCWLH